MAEYGDKPDLVNCPAGGLHNWEPAEVKQVQFQFCDKCKWYKKPAADQPPEEQE